MINETQILEMTPGQILMDIHWNLTVPSLIALYVIALIVFYWICISQYESAGGKKKFKQGFVVAAIIIGAILTFFILAPNTVYDIMKSLTG